MCVVRRSLAGPLSVLVLAVGLVLAGRGAAAVELRTVPSVAGTILVDADGFTLYRFDPRGEPVSIRRTDPRVDALPERRLVGCDGGSRIGWLPVAYSPDASLAAA